VDSLNDNKLLGITKKKNRTDRNLLLNAADMLEKPSTLTNEDYYFEKKNEFIKTKEKNEISESL
jgi:hypothetical protein